MLFFLVYTYMIWSMYDFMLLIIWIHVFRNDVHDGWQDNEIKFKKNRTCKPQNIFCLSQHYKRLAVSSKTMVLEDVNWRYLTTCKLFFFKINKNTNNSRQAKHISLLSAVNNAILAVTKSPVRVPAYPYASFPLTLAKSPMKVPPPPRPMHIRQLLGTLALTFWQEVQNN